MKICFVGAANSAHMIKWCNWFTGHGYEIHVISFTSEEIEGAQVHSLNAGVDAEGSDLSKLKYLLTGRQIRKIINEIKPDIVSVHYATSYGIAVALSGIKGYTLSVWGSDIYDFPQRSPLHKALLKYSLRKAGHLFSTSQAMADEAHKYTNRTIDITPFGVDMELFNVKKRIRTEDKPLIVGTVKTLSYLYGIDYILRAVAMLKEKDPELDIRIRIAGDGPQAEEFTLLAKELKIGTITDFLGKIPQERAAMEWSNMDAAVIPTVRYESFGVAAIEAQACGIPVIVSDVGGLKEVTEPGKSSIVVPKKSEQAIADAIRWLYDHPEERKKMGFEGRRFVSGKYELDQCFRHIEDLLIRYQLTGH